MYLRPLNSQISLCICAVWLESSLGAFWIVKDTKLLHVDNQDWSDCTDVQADLSLPWGHIRRYVHHCGSYNPRKWPFCLTVSSGVCHKFCLLIISGMGLFIFSFLTLVLLDPEKPHLCKQCRSRSVGFWRSQLIWICTVCHSVCELVSATWIMKSDWLTVRSGCGISFYSAWQGLSISLYPKCFKWSLICSIWSFWKRV